PILDDPAAAAAARRSTGWDERALVFGVFGGISRIKRVPTVVAAFRALRSFHGGVRLIVAGRPDDPEVLARVRLLIEEAGLESVARVVLDPAKPELERLITASDVVVNLRWPTAGETSAVMLRAFAPG